MDVHVVYNQHAGHHKAKKLLDAVVRPRLEAWCHAHHETRCMLHFHETDAQTGAIGTGRALTQQAIDRASVYVVLGGDGTVHELLQGMYLERRVFLADHGVSLVIVPVGTGNALYHSHFGPDISPSRDPTWRLRSLEAFLRSAPAGRASCALTVMRANPGSRLACVVVSHALHTAILRDSEALRSNHPGLERFQMAAEKNATVWCDAVLTLLPQEQAPVTVYDPTTRIFRAVNEKRVNQSEMRMAEEDATLSYECMPDGRVRLRGPFIYMNAMTVDRLEPTFVPAPFASVYAPEPLRRPSDAMDVVVMRPMQRRPTGSRCVSRDEEAVAYASDVLYPALFQGMYKQGRHVDMTYTDHHEAHHVHEGNRPFRVTHSRPVVEYFRAAGYEWTPLPGDEQAHSMCVDGTVVNVDHANVQVLRSAHVYLWG